MVKLYKHLPILETFDSLHNKSSNHLCIDEEIPVKDKTSDASANFCNLWLDAVCMAVTGHLLDETLNIKYLSNKGGKQLAVDFNYFMNVLSAVCLPDHPHPILMHISQLVILDNDLLKGKLDLP